MRGDDGRANCILAVVQQFGKTDIEYEMSSFAFNRLIIDQAVESHLKTVIGNGSFISRGYASLAYVRVGPTCE